METSVDYKRVIFTLARRRLPPRLRNNENFYFFMFCVSCVFFLFLLTPFFLSINQIRPAWSGALASVLVIIVLALWHKGTPLVWCQMAYQSTLLWLIVYNSYFTGGVTSPTLVWLGIVPILPLFTVSRSWCYFWLFVSFASVGIIYLGQSHELIPVLHNETHEELALAASMIGLLSITQLLLVTTYDTTQGQHMRLMRRQNDKLKDLSDDLQQAGQYKDRFLNTVSHEMRTPLNAVNGYLGLLATHSDMPTHAISFVHGAQNAAAHLLTVINDLLDFSQIKQGRLLLNPQTVNLHKVLTETHQTLAPQAAEQGLDYVLKIDPNLPTWVVLDPHRLAQIFLNLLGNALKFTQYGFVLAHARLITNLPDTKPMLELEVQDTGVGIASDSLSRIFEPFIQIDSHKSLKQDHALKGNGLGLSITQSLLQNMQGDIEVKSQVGYGSTFTIRLLLDIATQPVIQLEKLKEETHAERIDLLLVDDHAINRLVASATIKRALPNAHVDEARNGTEAIEKMKSKLYDLVLMDLVMPDYSGIEVTRIIRTECASPLKDVNIVALTANLAEDAIQQCKSLQIHDVLPKPFDRELLTRTILKYAKHER